MSWSLISRTKTPEFVAEFIEIWHGEKSLWDVKNPVFKDRNAKMKSFGVFKEKLDIDGKFCISFLTENKQYYNNAFSCLNSMSA